LSYNNSRAIAQWEKFQVPELLEQDSGIWWKESMTERVELWAESETPFLSGRSGTTLWLGIKDMRPLAIYTVYIPRGNLNVQLTFWR
jgi:hypothetical protein